MKKVLSLLLVLLMVAALGTTAFADAKTNHYITVTNVSTAEHSYVAYQVFAGNYNAETGKLTDITWGAGVNGEALLTALKADEDFGKDTANAFYSCTTAEAVAAVLDANKNTANFAQNFADAVGKNLATVAGTSTATAAATGYTYSIPVTGDGYYFIKDQKDPTYPTGSQTVDTLTDYILQVVGDVTVVAKSDTVTVKKEVATGGYDCITEHEHSIEGGCKLAYADSNTAQVDDIVSFKLTSTVPEKAASYDYFYFIFGDTLSNGLTFDKDNSHMAVTIGGTPATEGKDYTVSTNYNGYTFAIALTNAKAHAGETVVVTYEATVNANAVAGLGGNTNEVVVEYSKDPNEEYDGGSDGFPKEGGKDPDGKTPGSITKTYVTQLTLLKVDADTKAALEGAEFTITGTTESVIVRTKDVFTEDNTNGTYYQLKDGSYTTKAPQAEAMVAQDAGEAREGGYVVCDKNNSAVKYEIGGAYYREATMSDLSGTETLYTYMASNEYQYESTTTKYTKTTETVYECFPETFSAFGTTGADGTITLKGLNAGTYTITELVAPDGYNLLKNPITVTITCKLPDAIVTGNEPCDWTYSQGDEQTDGTVVVTVENNSGSVLPTTGGIGTTIFYILGSLLVVGAVVLFVTKRRMSAKG